MSMAAAPLFTIDCPIAIARKFGGQHRPCVMPALGIVDAGLLQIARLHRRFHAFRDDLQLELAGQVDDAGQYRMLVIRTDADDEGTIQFEHITWKFVQIAQAGIAGPAIIQRNAMPPLPRPG